MATASGARSAATTATSVPAVRVDGGQRRAIDKYLASLPADAPLRAIVAAPEMQELIGRYEQTNQRALDAQQQARKSGRTWLVAATFGTIIGAILLSPLPNLPRALGIVQTVALVVSLVALWWISRRKPIDRWMLLRGDAEHVRRQLFDDMLSAAPPAGADPVSTLGQKLGCFVAAHLDYQLAYFSSAARKHRTAARQTTPLKLVSYAVFAAALVFGAAILVQTASSYGFGMPEGVLGMAKSISVESANRWQLALSAIASAILTFVGACSDMDQNDRNASRYEASATHLQRLEDRELPAARAAAAVGDIAGVHTFTRQVQTVLAHEHLAWFLAMDPVDDRLVSPRGETVAVAAGTAPVATSHPPVSAAGAITTGASHDRPLT